MHCADGNANVSCPFFRGLRDAVKRVNLALLSRSRQCDFKRKILKTANHSGVRKAEMDCPFASSHGRFVQGIRFYSLGWSRDGILFRPSVLNSFANRCLRHSQGSGPFCQMIYGTIGGDVTISSGVGCLFAIGGPSTILGTVIAVLVWIAINRVCIRRSRPHVANECGKTVLPFVAHDNSTAAVVLKCDRLGVVASLPDASPDLIFGRSSPAMLERPTLPPLASTANDSAGSQSVNILNCVIPAITKAPPSTLYADFWSQRYYGKTSEPLIGEINSLHGSIIPFRKRAV